MTSGACDNRLRYLLYKLCRLGFEIRSEYRTHAVLLAVSRSIGSSISVFSILFLRLSPVVQTRYLPHVGEIVAKLLLKKISKEFGNIQGLQCSSTVFGISYNV
jgi:hypothetical protein